MRKLLGVLLSILVVVVVTTSVALAYTGVQGLVVDGYGNPWTHGGTVTCVQNTTGVTLGTGTIQPDGTWFVYIGSPNAVTCTIDPAPPPGSPPENDPFPYTCNVPGGGGGGVQIWNCGTGSTGTGPNAVTLAGFGATGVSASAWVLALSAVLAGVVAWSRRR